MNGVTIEKSLMTHDVNVKIVRPPDLTAPPPATARSALTSPRMYVRLSDFLWSQAFVGQMGEARLLNKTKM